MTRTDTARKELAAARDRVRPAEREARKELAAARDGVRAAEREARLARIAAADDLWTRAIARTRLVKAALAALLVAALALAVAAIVLLTGNGDDDHAGRAQALSAATTGVTTMLTADPADAEAFADRVIGISAGARRDQLTAARDGLIDAARGLTAPSTGNVIVAGLRTDPTDGDAEGSTAQVLVVAEASDPELVGSTAPGDRITLSVRLMRTADGWRITGAVPVRAGS